MEQRHLRRQTSTRPDVAAMHLGDAQPGLASGVSPAAVCVHRVPRGSSREVGWPGAWPWLPMGNYGIDPGAVPETAHPRGSTSFCGVGLFLDASTMGFRWSSTSRRRPPRGDVRRVVERLPGGRRKCRGGRRHPRNEFGRGEYVQGVGRQWGVRRVRGSRAEGDRESGEHQIADLTALTAHRATHLAENTATGAVPDATSTSGRAFTIANLTRGAGGAMLERREYPPARLLAVPTSQAEPRGSLMPECEVPWGSPRVHCAAAAATCANNLCGGVMPTLFLALMNIPSDVTGDADSVEAIGPWSSWWC
jgi:hypothetical protein